jgi:hypothetical protein
MSSIKLALKNSAFVPYAVYLVSVMLYGMWSMMAHLHWVAPIALVALAATTGKTYLVFFNMAAASVMAVYGVASQFGLSWYTATAVTVAPLLVMIALTSGVSRRVK